MKKNRRNFHETYRNAKQGQAMQYANRNIDSGLLTSLAAKNDEQTSAQIQ